MADIEPRGGNISFKAHSRNGDLATHCSPGALDPCAYLGHAALPKERARFSACYADRPNSPACLLHYFKNYSEDPSSRNVFQIQTKSPTLPAGCIQPVYIAVKL